MKLLYCRLCKDLVRPLPAPNVPRPCACGRHVIWLADARLRVLRILDRHADKNDDGVPNKPAAWVIHIHNDLLTKTATASEIAKDLVADPHVAPWFRQHGLIVKSVPGEIGDVAWASDLPTREFAPRLNQGTFAVDLSALPET